MSKIITNKVTILYVDLGRETIRKEESDLRAKIDRPTMPDNDQIMAYPYPYQMDRRVWTNVFVDNENGALKTEYSVTFCHCCLMWQHVRIYSLSADEYARLIAALSDKYGSPRIAVFEPSEHWQTFNMMHTWDFDTVETRGNF